jgi:hypothetical protein
VVAEMKLSPKACRFVAEAARRDLQGAGGRDALLAWLDTSSTQELPESIARLALNALERMEYWMARRLEADDTDEDQPADLGSGIACGIKSPADAGPDFKNGPRRQLTPASKKPRLRPSILRPFCSKRRLRGKLLRAPESERPVGRQDRLTWTVVNCLDSQSYWYHTAAYGCPPPLRLPRTILPLR